MRHAIRQYCLDGHNTRPQTANADAEVGVTVGVVFNEITSQLLPTGALARIVLPSESKPPPVSVNGVGQVAIAVAMQGEKPKHPEVAGTEKLTKVLAASSTSQTTVPSGLTWRIADPAGQTCEIRSCLPARSV